MNPKIVLLFLGVSLCAAVPAPAKVILPDACGDDKVTFEVKTEKDQPPPAGPADGKAQIVFIENENQGLGFGKHATIRFGLDGAWAGADNDNSYFVASVDPGVHHLCASWQSSFTKVREKTIDVASFTAEAGKVYYFAANIVMVAIQGAQGPGVTSGGGGGSISFNLTPLNEDEGKYRVKAWKLSTWKTK